MIKKILFSYILLIILIISVKAQNYIVKSVIYWTSPVMNEREALCLSYYKIAIIDEENIKNNEQELKLIKKLNRNIKLICYSNPMELFSPMVSPRPIQTALAKEILGKYPEWLLKTSIGDRVVFYRGMIMLNLSENCPVIRGKKCSEFLAEQQLITLKDSIWDGYFMDNAGGNISWLNHMIDSDSDKIPDDSISLDHAWLKGIKSYALKIKNGMRKGNLLLGNKGSLDLVDVFDGKTFEKFPNDYLGGKKDFGWHKCMNNARRTGDYTVFTVEPSDLNFGQASALLLDNVYIAVGQNNPTIHNEFRRELGEPIDEAGKNDSCYFRLYKNGRVDVFPSQRRGGNKNESLKSSFFNNFKVLLIIYVYIFSNYHFYNITRYF